MIILSVSLLTMKGNCSKVRTYVFLTFYGYKTGYFLKDYVHNQEESDIHNIFWILFFEREKPRGLFVFSEVYGIY